MSPQSPKKTSSRPVSTRVTNCLEAEASLKKYCAQGEHLKDYHGSEPTEDENQYENESEPVEEDCVCVCWTLYALLRIIYRVGQKMRLHVIFYFPTSVDSFATSDISIYAVICSYLKTTRLLGLNVL